MSDKYNLQTLSGSISIGKGDQGPVGPQGPIGDNNVCIGLSPTSEAEIWFDTNDGISGEEIATKKFVEATNEELSSRLDNLIISNGDGNKDSELIDARNGEITLGNKIRKIDESLDNKANKTYVDGLIGNNTKNIVIFNEGLLYDDLVITNNISIDDTILMSINGASNTNNFKTSFYNSNGLNNIKLKIETSGFTANTTFKVQVRNTLNNEVATATNIANRNEVINITIPITFTGSNIKLDITAFSNSYFSGVATVKIHKLWLEYGTMQTNSKEVIQFDGNQVKKISTGGTIVNIYPNSIAQNITCGDGSVLEDKINSLSGGITPTLIKNYTNSNGVYSLNIDEQLDSYIQYSLITSETQLEDIPLNLSDLSLEMEYVGNITNPSTGKGFYPYRLILRGRKDGVITTKDDFYNSALYQSLNVSDYKKEEYKINLKNIAKNKGYTSLTKAVLYVMDFYYVGATCSISKISLKKSNNSISKLCGMTVGDSFTYPKQYQQKLQFGYLLNTGIQGKTIAQFKEQITEDNIRTKDIVTVMGGANDFGTNRALGTITDDVGTDTLYGSIKELIEHIYTLKPNVKLVFITQPFKSHTNGLIVNSAGMKITDIPIAVKEVCNLYGVPVFDYYNLCEINNITKSQYISADNLHPTATLQEKFGIALNNFIENLYI